ncbi:hypothetical protein [Acetobacter fallax]|uniref:Uncharacterized protein n=1 Tax=Acetobacter fallax TaxID=1737473 RepID=A0ABX0KDW2_9PROT|nr:hypothetical protein [Acetobacter fallax]NHO33303.1 hypothetical protein [Acetobacter fallax]NHO36924.1 hypothetical protein [Acetobacter fallax]
MSGQIEFSEFQNVLSVSAAAAFRRLHDRAAGEIPGLKRLSYAVADSARIVAVQSECVRLNEGRHRNLHALSGSSADLAVMALLLNMEVKRILSAGADF